MTVGVLVVFWVVVGVGVVLVAMSATRRRHAGGKESKTTTRATVLAVVAAFVLLGGVVPALVMITNADDDAEARGGVDLTAAQVEGRQLFAQHCSQCHTLAASNAVGTIGPNLDTLRPNEELVLNAIEQGRARGRGQMPAQVVTGTDAEDVASYVAAVAGR
ncbi:MAG TPA: cytochrome c [Capillimicrobium sp.]|nr:cytochrome c [Capillimicrobium sp.]